MSILSEEEARTKQCRAQGAVVSMAIEVLDDLWGWKEQGRRVAGVECCCIASDCMMWRWNDPARQIKDKTKFPFGPSRNLQMALAPEKDWEPTPNRRGFCGLAGKPDQ